MIERLTVSQAEAKNEKIMRFDIGSDDADDDGGFGADDSLAVDEPEDGISLR